MPALLLILVVLSPRTLFAQPFTVGLIGDVPYFTPPGVEDPSFQGLQKRINQANLDLLVHVGDIKSGGSPCNDAMFTDRQKRFQAFKAPFLYTPGDNEWTDCHRVAAGGFDPLERLAALRKRFFSENALKPLRPFGLEFQAKDPDYKEFVEHLRFHHQGITFLTLHMVGSQNGKKKFDPHSKQKRKNAHDQEVKRREEAVLSWLKEGFAAARKNKSKGVIVVTHANPGLERDPREKEQKPFRFFLEAFARELRSFAGEVLLVHGDSHYFRVDKPLIQEQFFPNLTRVEVFGDVNLHWVKVKVDAESPLVFAIAAEARVP